MDETEGFFSRDHNRLLIVATWAKYLAWIALIVAFLLPIAGYISARTNYQYSSMGFFNKSDFAHELRTNPAFAFSVFLDLADGFIKGLSYFLALKAVSVGLNMIVETDINYRERRREAGVQ